MSAFVHKGRKVAETVDTPVQGILTQAEYDALPDDRKNEGFYIVEDGSENAPTYEAGDGITIQDNVLSVTTPVNTILTQSEFDALPVEQQSKGMYVINDGKNESSGGSSGEVYSTEETRIGTWINGKPLYRKVYETEVTGTNTIVATDIAGTLNIDSVTKIRGTFTRRLKDGTFLVMDIPSAAQVDASKFYCASMYPMLNTKSELEVYVNSDMLYESTAKVLIIFEYTKTTDPEVIT